LFGPGALYTLTRTGRPAGPRGLRPTAASLADGREHVAIRKGEVMKSFHLAGLPRSAAGLLIAAVIPCVAAGRDQPAADPAGRVDRHGDPLPPGALLRLGTVHYRQETPIEQIVYSPDGRFAATDGDDAEVRIWDGRDGRLLRRIEVGPAEIRALAFSPNSRTLAAASYRVDPVRRGYFVDVTYVEVASGTRIVRGPWPEQDSVGVVALSPDHRLLATGTTGGTLQLRDAKDGDDAGRFLIGRRDIFRIAFAASGGRVAALSRDLDAPDRQFRVDVFDSRSRSALLVIPEIADAKRLTFSPDGRRVCTGDKFLECRDAASGLAAGIGQTWGEDVAFSADGRLAAVFHWPDVNIQDVSMCQTVASIACSTSRPTAWAFSPDGSTVAANGGPTALHFWDVRTGRDRLATGDAHTEPVRCLLFTADGKTVITGGDDRTIRLWDAASGEPRKVLNLAGKPRALALSPDGRLLIAGAEENGWIFTWDLAAPAGTKPIILLDRFSSEGYPLAVRCSAADAVILAAWSDGRLLEGDRRSGELRARKPAKILQDSAFETQRPDSFRSGVLLAGGSRLAVIQQGKGMGVADVGSGRELWESAGATIVAAAADGRTVAVALQHDDPYYQPPSWKVDRGAPRRHRADADRPVAEVVLLGDEMRTEVVLLDGETGQQARRIPVPAATVWGLAFAPDGKTLAVTTDRGPSRIRLYQVATGRPVRSIPTPPISGPALAFSPDGSRLATAMADTSVLLWDLRPGP
jgi:WD40 repeat protein